MVQLTNKLKYEIIVKSEMGMSSNKIAESMNINVKTVLKWINRYKNENTIECKSKSGRKKKIDDNIDNNIADCILDCNSNITLDIIKNKLKKKKINISKSSIRNRLMDPEIAKIINKCKK